MNTIGIVLLWIGIICFMILILSWLQVQSKHFTIPSMFKSTKHLKLSKHLQLLTDDIAFEHVSPCPLLTWRKEKKISFLQICVDFRNNSNYQENINKWKLFLFPDIKKDLQDTTTNLCELLQEMHRLYVGENALCTIYRSMWDKVEMIIDQFNLPQQINTRDKAQKIIIFMIDVSMIGQFVAESNKKTIVWQKLCHKINQDKNKTKQIIDFDDPNAAETIFLNLMHKYYDKNHGVIYTVHRNDLHIIRRWFEGINQSRKGDIILEMSKYAIRNPLFHTF